MRLRISRQAGLRCDGDAHLVGNFEPVATDKRFLGDEYLDVPLEFELQNRWQPMKIGNAVLEDTLPRRRKRQAAQLRAAAFAQ